MKQKIGLIVNPVAGMGGSVGLKGTDGEMYKKALELGASPVTPERTRTLISHIKNKDKMTLFAASGKMGADYLQNSGVEFRVLGEARDATTAEDTSRTARQMTDEGIDLLIFVGGDGTARDVCDSVGGELPVVAVPSGVKVFSSVFATSDRAAADMVDAFLEGAGITEGEVLDIDEDAFREDRLASKLYGYLKVPDSARSIQTGKEASSTGGSAAKAKKEIASCVVEEMDHGTLYLLGPGTTLKAIADEAGIEKTLLGVDALAEGKQAGKDLNERGILELFDKYENRKILVTPIGGNGFILGRGSKQFTPEVVRKVGRDNIIVVGTLEKVSRLDCLRVDTGSYQLDRELSGYMEVVTGYRESMKVTVSC